MSTNPHALEARRTGEAAFRSILPIAVIAVTFAAMAHLTWGKWPDLLVDVGVELYVPWQLTEGRLLARDLAYGATGPVPPYLNALFFGTFGVGLRTLVIANLAVLAAITSLLYLFLREIAGRAWATVACVFLLAVFAFGQYTRYGPFNFVTPYCHGITHGLLLALATIGLQWRFARTGQLRFLIASSVFLGLVFLTKPEIFVASAGATAMFLALLLRGAAGRRSRGRLLLAATLPALLPAAVSFSLLAAMGDPTSAREATFFPWLLMRTPVVHTPFYRRGFGLDEPGKNLWVAFKWMGIAGAALVPAALVDLRVGPGRYRWLVAAVAAAVVAGGIWLWIPPSALEAIPRPLPFVTALGTWLVVHSAWRDGERCSPTALLHATLSTFALLLLLKMGLFARIYHYGFALAMPATLLAIVWVGSSVPRYLRSTRGSGTVVQAVVLTALLFFAGACIQRTSALAALKKVTVGTGTDRFLADRRGLAVNEAMEWLSRSGEPGATLAVLPEGAMVNYLIRRPSPGRYLVYMPDTLAAVGEEALLASLLAHPPSYVLVVARDASEHGGTTFGRDYAVETWRWIAQRYEPVASSGGSPFENGPFGVLLLRHRATEP